MSPKVDWKAKAAAKIAAILDAIPDSWRIPEPIATADAQRDITGTYLHKYLTGDEIEITETNTVRIVKKVADGEWRAETVARAFYHRAALAHQYVSWPFPYPLSFNRKASLRETRSLAYMRCSSMRPSRTPLPSTSTIASMASQSGRFTDCQSVSKTKCTSRGLRQPWDTWDGLEPFRVSKGVALKSNSRARLSRSCATWVLCFTAKPAFRRL